MSVGTEAQAQPTNKGPVVGWRRAADSSRELRSAGPREADEAIIFFFCFNTDATLVFPF